MKGCKPWNRLLIGVALLVPGVAGCRATWDEATVRGAEQMAVTARAQAQLWQQARPLVQPVPGTGAEQVRVYLDAHGAALSAQAESSANLARALRMRVGEAP